MSLILCHTVAPKKFGIIDYKFNADLDIRYKCNYLSLRFFSK